MSNPIEQVRTALGGELPWAFCQDSPVPLAVGTFGVLVSRLAETGMEPEDAHKLASKFLAQWCRARRYVQACAADEAQRFTLDGTYVGPVSPEDRTSAANRVFAYGSADVARAMKAPSQPKKDSPPKSETLVAGKPKPVLRLGVRRDA